MATRGRASQGFRLCDDKSEVRRTVRLVWRNAPLSLGVGGFAVLALQVETGVGGAWLANINNKYTYDAILVLAALNCFSAAGSAPIASSGVVGVAISAWACRRRLLHVVARREGKHPVPVALRRGLPPLLSAGLRRACRALPQGGARDRPEPLAGRRDRSADDGGARGERRLRDRRALARRQRRNGGRGRDEPRLSRSATCLCSGSSSARSRCLAGASRRDGWSSAAGSPCSPSATASTSSRSRRTRTPTARSTSAGRPACC